MAHTSASPTAPNSGTTEGTQSTLERPMEAEGLTFNSHGQAEPSVDPVYPDDEPKTLDSRAEIREALGAVIDYLFRPGPPKTQLFRLAAVQFVFRPTGESLSQVARRMGVPRETLQRAVSGIRAITGLSDKKQ